MFGSTILAVNKSLGLLFGQFTQRSEIRSRPLNLGAIVLGCRRCSRSPVLGLHTSLTSSQAKRLAAFLQAVVCETFHLVYGKPGTFLGFAAFKESHPEIALPVSGMLFLRQGESRAPTQRHMPALDMVLLEAFFSGNERLSIG